MSRLFGWLFCLVVGCAPIYTPPGPLMGAPDNEIIVDAPFNKTWSALIDHVAGTFFSIQSFERASGLLLISQ